MYVWFASKPPSVVRKKKKSSSVAAIASQHKGALAGIRTTALACAHASGASEGSDVRAYRYIDIT